MSKTLTETLNSHPDLSAGQAVENQFYYNELGMMRRRILALRGDSAAVLLMHVHDTSLHFALQPPYNPSNSKDSNYE